MQPHLEILPKAKREISPRELRYRVAMGRAISAELKRLRLEAHERGERFTNKSVLKLLGETSAGHVGTDLANIGSSRHGADVTIPRLIKYLDVLKLPDPFSVRLAA